jgi:type IV pilus assembly protein PilO
VLVWKDQYDALDRSQQEEVKLKEQYATKKAKAINYDIYVQQLKEIEQSFGALLKQLPNKAEMDALLTDINQAGLGPRPAVRALQACGAGAAGRLLRRASHRREDHRQLSRHGRVRERRRAAPRIVTLNDIAITNDKGVLTLDAVAKTFRYLDEEELAKQRKAAKDAKDKAARNEALGGPLVGCVRAARGLRGREPPGSSRVDDDQGKSARGRVDPLPQIKPYEPFAYNAFDLPIRSSRARSSRPRGTASSRPISRAAASRSSRIRSSRSTWWERCSRASRRTRWCGHRTRTSTR